MWSMELAGVPLGGVDSMWHAEHNYRFDVLTEGTAPGSPEAVIATMQVFGQDGEQARIEGWTSVTTPIRVKVSGADLMAVSQGAAALRRLLPDGYGPAVDLVWRPPDPSAPAAVRKVSVGTVTPLFSDADELRSVRIYQLDLIHEPSVRSEFESVAVALAGSPGTPTVLYPGGTVSGWTATATGATGPFVPDLRDGGAHVHAEAGADGEVIIELDYDQPITGTGMYVKLQWHSWVSPSQVVGGKVPMVNGAMPISGSESAGGAIYRVADMDYTHELRVRLGAWYPGRTGSLALRVMKIERVHSYVDNPSAFSRVLTVGGTERTSATIELAAPEQEWNGVKYREALGLTVVHTGPFTAWDPNLMPRATSDTTPSSVSVSRRTYPLSSTALVIDIPVGEQPPGVYTLGVWLRPTVTGDITVRTTVETSPGGWGVAYTEEVDKPIGVRAGLDQFITLGRFQMPTVDTNTGTTQVRIRTVGPATGVADIHGVWAFPAGRDTALTVLSSPEPYATIVGASMADPGRWLVSPSPGVDEAYSPGPQRIPMPGAHHFAPGEASAYVISYSPVDEPAAMSLRYTQRWIDWPAHPGGDTQ